MRRDCIENENGREAASPLAALTDSHDVVADVPDKSNRLCRFKRTMMASASDPPAPPSPKENSRTNREERYRCSASPRKLLFFEEANGNKLKREKKKVWLHKRWNLASCHNESGYLTFTCYAACRDSTSVIFPFQQCSNQEPCVI